MNKLFFERQIWLLFATTLLFPFMAFADDDKPPAIVEMWRVQVNNDEVNDFETAFKKHIVARQKAGDPRAWQVYVATTGDLENNYFIRYCCFNWADQDVYEQWTNQSNMAEHWNKGAGKYAKGYSHHFFWVDIANSNWPENLNPAFVGVRSYSLKAGSNVGDSVKALSKMAKSMNWQRHWAWDYNITGENNLYLVFPFKDFADMQAPEPSFSETAAKHLGSKEKVKAIFDKFSSNFSDSHYTIYRHRKDLSMGQ